MVLVMYREEEFIKQKNKELCERFPILLPHNRFTGKIPDDYDYAYTELDAMPEGWLKAFGLDMIKEIQEYLNTLPEHARDSIAIVDIKEKFGYLHVYLTGYNKALREIISKYEQKSKFICIKCGKPATKISTGWICPWCDDCSQQINDKLEPIEAFYAKYED